MKKHLKFLIIIVFAACLLPLCACGSKKEVYEKKIGGITYTVDPMNQTITAGRKVYTYTKEGGSYTVRYPDGRTLYWSPTSIKIGGSEMDKHLDFTAEDLSEILEEEFGKTYNASKPNWPIALVFWGLGVWLITCPKSFWYLNFYRYRWRNREEEPSETEMLVYRVIGGILIVVGFIMLFMQ